MRTWWLVRCRGSRDDGVQRPRDELAREKASSRPGGRSGGRARAGGGRAGAGRLSGACWRLLCGRSREGSPYPGVCFGAAEVKFCRDPGGLLRWASPSCARHPRPGGRMRGGARRVPCCPPRGCGLARLQAASPRRRWPAPLGRRRGRHGVGRGAVGSCREARSGGVGRGLGRREHSGGDDGGTRANLDVRATEGGRDRFCSSSGEEYSPARLRPNASDSRSPRRSPRRLSLARA